MMYILPTGVYIFIRNILWSCTVVFLRMSVSFTVYLVRDDLINKWNQSIIKKSARNSSKNTMVQIKQNPGLISCFPLSSPNIPSLKALTEKLTHDQPLCTYLMRYDSHIQSPPRSWPQVTYTKQKLKSDEKNSSVLEKLSWFIRHLSDGLYIFYCKFVKSLNGHLGPSHRKCPMCLMIFMNTGIQVIIWT